MSARRGVSIVTGASRGTGRAITCDPSKAGYAGAVNYRDHEPDARAVVEEIGRAGGRARAFRAEVGDREAGQALVRATVDAFGQIDVLVNNAGIHLPGVGLADVRPGAWERILRLNLSAPFYLIQAVLPQDARAPLRPHREPLVQRNPRFPATYGPYTVSKSGLEALRRILAEEEGRHGPRINAVAPARSTPS
jgi:NAD(P)-dependent dehydrogenase (short-subunit alcohol dehydrogenase family)